MSKFILSDDITFWSRQVEEHMLILALGLEEPNLKTESLQYQREWQAFQTRGGNLSDLIRRTHAFQKEINDLLHQGKWLGWIYPSYMHHITMELEYFERKSRSIVFTCEEEFLFWNDVHGDHAALASHMIDPSEKASKDAHELGTIIQDLNADPEICMYKELSLRYGEELDAFNTRTQANPPLSIIHPVLLDHIIREGKRGNAIMAACIAVQESHEDSDPSNDIVEIDLGESQFNVRRQ